MPTYVPPKKNTEFIFFIGLPSQANGSIFQVNPTLAVGDFKVSIDGGALTNLTTLPTVTPAGGRLVKVTLSAAEMNGDNIIFVASDAAGAEWRDVVVCIQTATKQIDDLLLTASYVAPDNATIAATGATVASNLNATVSSRLDSASYVIPDNTSIAATLSVLDGITSLANWLRVIVRKDSFTDATALEEINDSVGDFARSESIEAIYKRIDVIVPRFDQMLEQNEGLEYWRFTARALEQAPTAGNSSTGAWLIQGTVVDGITSNPIGGAFIRFSKGAETYVDTTDENGAFSFSLDSGNWDVSITANAYSFTPEQTSIDDNVTDLEFELTPIVLTPDPDPAKAIVVITAYNHDTELEEGVDIYIQQLEIPDGDVNRVYDGKQIKYTTDENGQIQVTLWKNARYRYRRGLSTNWIEFVPDEDVYSITSTVGG